SAEAEGSYLSRTYPERHVTGNGPNAYIQLSGTSMATPVVAGTVAVLLQEKPGLGPASVKAVLQLTSSFMPAAGVVACGAGSLNALAAIEFAAAPDPKNQTFSIAGEEVPGRNPLVLATVARGGTDALTVIWGDSDTVIWGNAATVIWGNADTV